MRLFTFLMLLLVCFAAPAPAQEKNSVSQQGIPLPFREDSGLTKAEYLIGAEKYMQAVHELGNVLSRHPENADAYTYRGYAYYQMGETDKARTDYKRALIINPKHLGANKYMGDIYLDNGEVQRAIEQLQVIRMTCGQTDCEEMNALQREINQYQKSIREAE